MTNPFNPGAGRKPPFLAGRAGIIESIQDDMASVYENSEGTRPIIVSGLRGMGKTVFLREISESAKRSGWLSIWVEASKNDSLAEKLSQAMYVELRRVKGASQHIGETLRHALGVLRSFQLKLDPSGTYTFGLGVEPASGYADSGNLSLDLSDLLEAIGEAARDEGTAVLICIDELQEAPKKDLAALNVALHAIGQGSSPVPVYFIGAGLPDLPAVLAEATSYAERMYRYYTLGTLDRDDVLKAYVEPTDKHHVSWDDDALATAIAAANGYPYFVQQCGYCICEQLGKGESISRDVADAGIELAVSELDRGLYKSRWDRASTKGKELMRAMTLDDGPSRMEDLAARLGKKSMSDLSVLRDRLIKDGLIFSPERGCVAFTVPGMRDYIEKA